MKKFFLTAFFLCAYYMHLTAQVKTNEPDAEQQPNFYFSNYGVKDGLSNGIVNDLFRDSEGFMWVSTFNGLSRFDGTTFKIFHADRRNPYAITDNDVQQVCEDHDRNIWCATSKGISRYDRNDGKFYNYQLSNPHGLIVNANFIANILCDRHGAIWCATSAGVYQYDKIKNNFIGYFHDADESNVLLIDKVFKNAFVEDPLKDGIWMGTPLGVNFLDTKAKVFYNYKNNPQKLALFDSSITFPITLDAKGNLWFAHSPQSKIFCYNISANSLSATPFITDETGIEPPKNISSIFVDSKMRVWISTWGYRPYYKNNGENIFRHFLHDEQFSYSINSDFFWDMIEDKDGTLWFGGINGISKLSPFLQYYSLLNLNNLLPAESRFHYIVSLLQQNDSLIWVGTNEGLYLYNMNSGKLKKIKMPVSDRDGVHINEIIEIDGVLWLSSYNGISFFDIKTQKFIKKNDIPDELLLNHKTNIGFIHKSLNGDVWISTLTNNNLYKYNKRDNKWISYKHNNADPHSVSAVVTGSMYEDENATKWFGTFEDGLMRYDDARDQFDFFKTGYEDTSKIRIANLLSICGGRKNELFLISSAYGLIRFNYKDSSAKLWRQSDGLATESNQMMVLDKQNNLWISGYQDATVLNINNNAISRFHIDYSNTDYIYGNVGLCFNNGNICITILDALAFCNPSVILRKNDAPKVLISDFSVFEKSVPFSNENSNIHLSYKENFFTVSFSSFSAGATDLQFAYKLEGYDKDWVYCGKKQIASYTNVPGGNYTFHCKATTDTTNWNVPEKTLSIHIDTVFYKTNLFWIIIVLVVSAILYFIYRNRLQQQQQVHLLQSRAQSLEKEKALVLYESLKQQLNPHFLFNSLTSLNSLINRNPKTAADFLNKLSKTYRYILKSRDNETVSLGDEIKFAENYIQLQQTRFEKGLEIKVEVEDKFYHTKIVPVTLQNLIENAIKHNIIDEELPLHIHIFIEDDFLVVQNNIQKKNFVETSNKQGLVNLQSLYHYLCEKPLEITENEKYFTVKIPLL